MLLPQHGDCYRLDRNRYKTKTCRLYISRWYISNYSFQDLLTAYRQYNNARSYVVETQSKTRPPCSILVKLSLQVGLSICLILYIQYQNWTWVIHTQFVCVFKENFILPMLFLRDTYNIIHSKNTSIYPIFQDCGVIEIDSGKTQTHLPNSTTVPQAVCLLKLYFNHKGEHRKHSEMKLPIL